MKHTLEAEWKTRLRLAIANQAEEGTSMRAISERSGLGPNYISQMLFNQKTPSVDKFLQICAVLHVSPTYILTGLHLTPPHS